MNKEKKKWFDFSCTCYCSTVFISQGMFDICFHDLFQSGGFEAVNTRCERLLTPVQIGLVHLCKFVTKIPDSPETAFLDQDQGLMLFCGVDLIHIILCQPFTHEEPIKRNLSGFFFFWLKNEERYFRKHFYALIQHILSQGHLRHTELFYHIPRGRCFSVLCHFLPHSWCWDHKDHINNRALVQVHISCMTGMMKSSTVLEHCSPDWANCIMWLLGDVSQIMLCGVSIQVNVTVQARKNFHW